MWLIIVLPRCGPQAAVGRAFELIGIQRTGLWNALLLMSARRERVSMSGVIVGGDGRGSGGDDGGMVVGEGGG